jgi:hypothetical protein
MFKSNNCFYILGVAFSAGFVIIFTEQLNECLQRGAQFPPGGKVRERGRAFGKQTRCNSGPTVTVWMEEDVLTVFLRDLLYY